MKVSIVLKGIIFGGISSVPEERSAVVAFEVLSDELGPIEFNVEVIPEPDDPHGIEDVVPIAQRTLIEFGTALADAGAKYRPPRIYSQKSQ
jgi:hypothetical protein